MTMLELLAIYVKPFQNLHVRRGHRVHAAVDRESPRYGIPPEQVVGSSIKTKYELRDGKPALVRLPEINFIDDKAGKTGRHQFGHIGCRPIAASWQLSVGDQQMLADASWWRRG